MAASPDVLIDMGDTHVGHRLAVCPPRGFVIDGGNLVLPNEIQSAINEAWARFQQMVRDVTKGKSYVYIHKGDVIEGPPHHGNIDTLSANIKDQQDNAVEVLKDICSSAAEVYFIRGTGAHAGKDSEHEEAIAQRLGAIPVVSSASGHERYTRQILVLDFCGYVVHAAHHIGTTGTPAGRATAPMKEITNLRESAGAFGLRAPDVVTRGHRHVGTCAGDVTRNGMGWSITTPGWQGKTGFAYKTVGGRTEQLVVGGGIHEVRNGRFLPWVQGYAIMPDLPVKGTLSA